MSDIYGYIYIIKNKLNEKIYIGKTTMRFNKRYSCDIFNTHNKELLNDLKKYGYLNFDIVEKFDKAYSKEELDRLEKMYISNHSNNIYNQYNKKMVVNMGIKHLGDSTAITLDGEWNYILSFFKFSDATHMESILLNFSLYGAYKLMVEEYNKCKEEHLLKCINFLKPILHSKKLI